MTLQTLYQSISAAFCVIVVISNVISVKMVSLPHVDFTIPAGLVIYPLTFLLSSLVTEIFGQKKAKLMVYIGLGMSVLSFMMIQAALMLPADNPEAHHAFQLVFGLSGLRIFSSFTAYLIAQVADIQIYAWIKRWTSVRFLWLRNNGSTSISQIIDTIIIDMIFLYWGLGMEMSSVYSTMLFSFAYKAFFSLICTPLFCFCVFFIRRRWNVAERLSQLHHLSLEN
jgi:queuosine precursor transporter